MSLGENRVEVTRRSVSVIAAPAAAHQCLVPFPPRDCVLISLRRLAIIYPASLQQVEEALQFHLSTQTVLSFLCEHFVSPSDWPVSHGGTLEPLKMRIVEASINPTNTNTLHTFCVRLSFWG